MTARGEETSLLTRRFGRFLCLLRMARGQTRDQLAERAGLSSDTIVGLECGAFSPTLGTMDKLVVGLGTDLHSFLTAFEFSQRDVEREIAVTSRSLSAADLAVAFRVLSFLADVLGTVAKPEDGEGNDDQ